MSIEGVDYSFKKPTATGLAAAGKRFAMVYVGPGSAGKQLTATERDQLRAAGLSIVLLAEGAAQDALNGRAEGIVDAGQALASAAALGITGAPIYFAVDWDITGAQWPRVVAYLQGAASVIGAALVGIYGGYDAIAWAARDDAAAWLFQTYAWSEGRWHPAAHIQQYRNGVALAGGTVDLDRAVGDDYGQWPRPTTTTLTEDEVLQGLDRAQVNNAEQYPRSLVEWTDNTQPISNTVALTPVPNRFKQVFTAVANDVSALRAAAAADATRDAAVLAAVTALANAGGVDAAPIVAAVREEAAATRQVVAQLQAEIAARDEQITQLRQALADAAQAQADALAPTAG